MSRDLLIEIGTEELPPKALKSLAAAFCEETRAGLERLALPFEHIKSYASPRRLATWPPRVATSSPWPRPST